jgi:hypothetical protein
MSDGPAESGINKIAISVVGSVVAAVIGFFLIAPGGALNPKPSPAPAEARITAFNGPNYSSVGEVPTRSFTVYNGGDLAAETCEIFWSPFGEKTQVVDIVLSEQFTLLPKQTKDFTLTAYSGYTEAAIFDETADVFCEASDYHSPGARRVVNSYGIR